MSRTSARGSLLRSLAIGVVVGGAIYAVFGMSSVGTVAASADDSSAVTVTAAQYDPDVANSPFPDLKVTVSQTTELVKQGIEVSWTGGKQSERRSAFSAGRNFLQIAQCWGEDPEWPGHPDRRTCQYGSFPANGQSRDTAVEGPASAEDAEYSAPGSFDLTEISIPFESSTGETVARIVDGKIVPGVDPGRNQYFTDLTTNEIVWAGSAADGTGQAKFEVQTAQQAPGLGCGRVEAGSSGPQSCWLVVIPRGENDRDQTAVNQPGLLWDTWKHHVAVKLEFKPSGSRCPSGAAERTVAGSELVASAMASWQPVLCGSGGAVFSTLTIPEADALLTANGTIDPQLALTSLPMLAGEGVTDNLAYAPVALTGISIAFAIDSYVGANTAPAEVRAREGQALADMKLTPRLLAKLLTNTYTDSMPRGARAGIEGNPRNLTQDPEFLEINGGDWAYQSLNGVGISDVLVPQGRSDVAWTMWSYILADADAAAFLAGAEDPWGATVNPWASSNPAVHPAGGSLVLPRDDFPRPDPTEDNTWSTPQNAVGHRPFTNDYDSSAYLVLRGDAQEQFWDNSSVPARYKAVGRALVGDQQVVGVTDTSAAAKYQVVQASLRNSAGQFVAPDDASLAAAAAAMTAHPDQSQVYGLDPASERARGAAQAYPLAVPVYAAINPDTPDAAARADFAELIRYAVTDGQTPGAADGQLPAGYTPLPEGWRTQALETANLIESGRPAQTPPAGTPAAPQGATANAAPPTAAGGASGTSFAPPAAAPTSVSDPAAQGSPAGALSGGQTPDDPDLGAVPAAVPISLAGGVVAALALPLVSAFRRRV